MNRAHHGIEICNGSLMERLENRRLLSGTSTGDLPDLTATLNVRGPGNFLPGGKATVALKVTNHGGNLARTVVPISLYLSTTPDQSGEVASLGNLNWSVSLRHEQGKKRLAIGTLPGNLPEGTFYIVAGFNSAGSGDESNHTVASRALNNPLGNYTGTATFNGAPEPMTIALSARGKKVFSTVTFPNNPGNFNPVNARSMLSRKGDYSLSASGAGTNLDGQADTYSTKIAGTISNGNISGDQLYLKSVVGKTKETKRGKFSVDQITES